MAAYGGIYIVASQLWLWLAEGHRPDTWDLVGGIFACGGDHIVRPSRPPDALPLLCPLWMLLKTMLSRGGMMLCGGLTHIGTGTKTGTGKTKISTAGCGGSNMMKSGGGGGRKITATGGGGSKSKSGSSK
ncbi:hypothetical protein B5V01_29190 [Mesorhizobium erdmanii]|uniref:Uncharacterized protein n=1 Tax=Mesorhizobium erdmanii TaxID=1777866 RepID=A0A4Q1UN18_9HYPH|nr:hypothetical protein B5V01_29190 [Mesorhizobium erdmanii]